MVPVIDPAGRGSAAAPAPGRRAASALDSWSWSFVDSVLSDVPLKASRWSSQNGSAYSVCRRHGFGLCVALQGDPSLQQTGPRTFINRDYAPLRRAVRLGCFKASQIPALVSEVLIARELEDDKMGRGGHPLESRQAAQRPPVFFRSRAAQKILRV
jgi:hypothetical protein